MKKTPLIELQNITKDFDGFFLNDISLDLYPGEVHVLVGENGSGKSTLMKLLSGWFSQDRGTILLDGEIVRFRDLHDARDRGIIYMPQEIQCFRNLTIAENLYFREFERLTGRLGMLETDRIVSMCRQTFSDLGISLDPQQKYFTLGYAEQQLVSAAISYVTNARVIIYDEPSSAMSQPEREILFHIIKLLKARGCAIFYISHRLDEISEVGDRVSVMHRGEIKNTTEKDGVSQDRLIELMTGEVQKKRYPKLPADRGKIVLSVSNLSFQPILKDISFDLRKGEILGITGLMGSGRTLLANCLFGVIKPSGGEIRVNGKKTGFSHPYDAMASGISLVPEDRINNGIFSKHDLQINMTSATLSRFQHNFILNNDFMNELTREYVDILKIRPGKLNTLIRVLSGGNQQKAMVAKWLMTRARIFIMDEPTRGIDAATKLDIYNAMNDLVAKGASIILISSEIEETLGMSDRILVMAGGQITRELTSREATKENIILAATAD